MAEHEFKPLSVSVNGADITGHGSGWVMSGDAEDHGTWGEYLAGLEPASMSMTLNNAGGFFEPAHLFPAAPAQRMRVTIAVPDGRWQGVKQRLKRFWPLRWLKVRYKDYSFTGEVDQWSENGVSGHAVSPIERGMTERR